MTDHKVSIDDQTETVDSTGDAATKRKTYTVTGEAGVFKNGQQYAKGDTIELDEKTAQNFIAAGDVKGDSDENAA